MNTVLLTQTAEERGERDLEDRELQYIGGSLCSDPSQCHSNAFRSNAQRFQGL